MKNKFRVWDKSIKYMDYRVRVTTTDDYIKVEALDTFSDWRELEEGQYELMQSTGLHDKNGKEIFEGDILKDKRGKIRFVYKVSGGFAINMFDSPRKIKDCFYESLADMQTQSWMQMSCEVIGNIYENPELLEVEE